MRTSNPRIPYPRDALFERGQPRVYRGRELDEIAFPLGGIGTGTLVLATPHEDLSFQTHWFRGSWFDSLHRFWDQVCAGELVENRKPSERLTGIIIGSIGLNTKLGPGEIARLSIWVALHNPNFEMLYADDFACFFSVNSGWGVVRQSRGQNTARAVVELNYGEVVLHRLQLGFPTKHTPHVTLRGVGHQAIITAIEDTVQLESAAPITIRAEESLTVPAWN